MLLTNLKENTLSKLSYITIYCIISLFSYIVVTSVSTQNYVAWVKIFALVNLLHLFFTNVLLRKLDFKWFSFAGLFIIIGYIYHFGQAYLTFIDYNFIHIPNFITLYASTHMLNALKYSFLIYIFTTAGIFSSISINKQDALSNTVLIKEGSYTQSIVNIKTLAFLMLFITFPITVYIDIQTVTASLAGNYLDTFENHAGILGAISDITYTGFILLILSFSKNKKAGLTVAITISTYIIFTMFGGRRGHQMIFLLLILYIIHKVYYKINWKNSLILFIIAFIGSSFANAVAHFRRIDNTSLGDFMNVFTETIADYPIYALISEMGASIQTPYYLMKFVPDSISFGWGETIYKSFFTIFININGILENILFDINYVEKLQIPTIGGSYPGELYFNFGVYGFIFAFFIGYAIQRLSFKMEYYLTYRNYYRFSFFVPIFIMGIWWVRNTFAAIIRLTVWNMIILIILKLILKNLARKK